MDHVSELAFVGPIAHSEAGKDLREYNTGLLDAGYSRLPPSPAKDEFEGTVDEHLRLLKLSEAILDILLQQEDIQKVAEPTLIHIDFHKRNIYVSDDDPRVVTAIIDWQSASIEPMFCYAHETPDFVEAPADIQEYLRQFRGPSSEDLRDDPAREKAKQKLEKEIDLCQKTYTTILRALIPNLWSTMQMDQRYVRLFRYCNSSWRDCAVALHQEILELSEGWQDLGLPGTSPYQPSEKALAAHRNAWEAYETVQKLRLFIFKMVGSNSDGWVPNEHWKEAQVICRDAFGLWMEAVEEENDPNMTVEEARRLWPFEIVQ